MFAFTVLWGHFTPNAGKNPLMFTIITVGVPVGLFQACVRAMSFAWCKSVQKLNELETAVKHNETRTGRERVVLLSTSNNLI